MATTREISYEADGRTMVGTLALPEGTDRRPGVLVCHEGPGLDDHARSRAVRLADELGYVAFALDYHGGGQPLADRGQMMARLGELREDPRRARAIATAGLDVLRGEARTDGNRLAAIGYCFGGTLALELARGGADISAVVGFHSGLAPARPEDARNIRGKVLMLIGADDPIVDNAQRRDFEEEMRDGGVDWQLHVYGGAVHSFTNPRASGVELAGYRLSRADRPALVAGHARPLPRGLRLSPWVAPAVSDAPSGAGYARCPCPSPCRRSSRWTTTSSSHPLCGRTASPLSTPRSDRASCGRPCPRWSSGAGS